MKLGNLAFESRHGGVADLPQQEFLREVASSLRMTQKTLSARMAVPWPTFEKWLAPAGSKSVRPMPEIARAFALEILAYEELKSKLKKH